MLPCTLAGQPGLTGRTYRQVSHVICERERERERDSDSDSDLYCICSYIVPDP